MSFNWLFPINLLNSAILASRFDSIVSIGMPVLGGSTCFYSNKSYLRLKGFL